MVVVVSQLFFALWKYLRLLQLLAIQFWIANRTFNSNHLHLPVKKVRESGGRRKEEAVVLQYAENDCRGFLSQIGNMALQWFESIDNACWDLSATLLCWCSVLMALTPYQVLSMCLRNFLVHFWQLSTCPFVTSVSWPAPKYLRVTGRMPLICVEKHVSNSPSFSF